jgi:predicted membrane protein
MIATLWYQYTILLREFIVRGRKFTEHAGGISESLCVNRDLHLCFHGDCHKNRDNSAGDIQQGTAPRLRSFCPDFWHVFNIRDLAPMVAGLVAGPYIGLAVGLIGGIHRLFLGGDSALACCLATILAGLLAGMVYRFNNGKLLGIIPAMLFAVGIELLHGGLALALIRPFTEALDIVYTAIPGMVIAVSLGVGISVIIIHSVKESYRAVCGE